jgi:hypothetical protein
MALVGFKAQSRPSTRWSACFSIFAVSSALLLAQTHPSASERRQILLGHDLFTGKADLHGRMSTHPDDLPPDVIRCSNCHAAGTGPDVPRSNAPRLTRDFLLVPRSRRGGPPSRYSPAAFCTVLRKGVDPAYIVINVEMPRYTIDDSQCTAIWRFLTEENHEPK